MQCLSFIHDIADAGLIGPHRVRTNRAGEMLVIGPKRRFAAAQRFVRNRRVVSTGRRNTLSYTASIAD